MRRIPTLAGLFLIIMIIGGLVLVTSIVKQNTNLLSQAGTGETLIIPLSSANITDTSFTLYWISATAKPGTISFGQSADNLDKVLTDNLNSQVHFLPITNLKAGTKYFYRLENGDGGLIGEVTTLSSPLTIIADPIYGKSVPEAIAVWEKEGETESRLAVLTKSDGSYVLPVAGMAPGQKETITIYTPLGNATITCTSGKDKPLPVVGVGDNIDCNDREMASNGLFNATTSASAGFVVPLGKNSATGGTLTVNLTDQEVVSTPLPTISGKAGPNQIVKIEIHSPQAFSGTVVADSLGNWSWTPPANLAPGKHTATITITNPDGTTQMITRSFTVLEGTSILPITSGTPSATLTHQACVSRACVKVEGGGANTCLTDADCAPVPVATPEPTIITPTPVVVPPPTGVLENTLLILAGGLVLVTIGVGLIL